MPIIVDTIGDIARRLERDVLYAGPPPRCEGSRHSHDIPDWKDSVGRHHLLEFLESNNIAWCRCYPFIEPGEDVIVEGDFGYVFVDIPFDKADPKYAEVIHVLENDDDSLIYGDYAFYVLTLNCVRTFDKNTQEH